LGDETRHAIDVLDLVDSVTIDEIKVNPKKMSDAANLNDEQRGKAFAAYADALGELEQCNVLARPSVYLQNRVQGTLSAGTDTQTTKVSVTATAQPDKTIGLDMEWQDLNNEQTLETTVQVPNLSVAIVGGVIRTNQGVQKERLMLLQPAIR
jgi:type II secretory pathway component GspD/PulD (secretin)